MVKTGKQVITFTRKLFLTNVLLGWCTCCGWIMVTQMDVSLFELSMQISFLQSKITAFMGLLKFPECRPLLAKLTLCESGAHV